MKYLLITLFLVYCTNPCLGNDIRSYYHNVYDAESLIIARDYKGAAASYKKAFTQIASPPAMDIYNYCVCELYTNNYEHAARLCERLVLKGASKGFFRKAVFKAFRQSKAWAALSPKLDSLEKQAAQYIRKDLIEQLNQLMEVDQAVHCLLPKNASDVAFIEQMNRVNDTTSRRLHELLIAHDYLNEEVIGGNFVDTILSPDPIYGTLVLHEFEKNSNALKADIDYAVTHGFLRPDVGMQWIEFSNFGKLNYVSDYQIFNDTLRVLSIGDTSSVRFKLTERNIVRILTSNRNKKLANDYMQYYLLDSPARVINKLIFCYRNIRFNRDDFIIIPGPGIIMSTGSGASDLIKLFKILDDGYTTDQ